MGMALSPLRPAVTRKVCWNPYFWIISLRGQRATAPLNISGALIMQRWQHHHALPAAAKQTAKRPA